MREENQFAEVDPFDDSDSSSDESSDLDSPERSKPTFISRFICGRTNEVHVSRPASENSLSFRSFLLTGKTVSVLQNPQRLSIKIEGDDPSHPTLINKKSSFHVSINPWKLITLSSEKALLAAEKARERLRKQKPASEQEDSLKPLPLETKFGPSVNSDKNSLDTATSMLSTPLVKLQVSPGRFSSPRRRFSGSSGMFSGVVPSPKQKYRSNFDLKLTEVSRELETYISRQVLCSVIKQDGSEASPR